ncbi:MAG: transglycosylase domain-containing protein [Candidatus Gracilibacteria bacterium]|nr:transglycosylase domain-containing protein [Candidatus Gracilibacteria bacterium]
MQNFSKEQIKKRIEKKHFQEMEQDDKKAIIGHLLWIVLGLMILFLAIIWLVYAHDLPSIKRVGEDILPESVMIYDKKGNELYNLYGKEKRTYVDIGKISTTMKDAIVSTEDKTFYQNKGFDFKGLIRAGANYILGKTDKIQGTSTISQQLIRNIFLNQERSIKRKAQELFLSYQLNSNYSKDKILELYLNKISYGSNAYGIEEASKTFFGKKASELGILESSIMASIPKGPTYYSPYNHSDRLMGYIYAYNENSPKDTIKIEETENPNFYKPLKDKFKAIITDMKFEEVNESKVKVCNLNPVFFKKDINITNGCTQIDYNELMTLINNIVIPYSKLNIENPNENLLSYILEYNTGRKDFVLGRMFEDDKINSEDYKNAFIKALDFKFKRYTENIKYPYFIFYVKEYLENKYGKDFESQGGLKIYTSIDPNLQDKAEELVKKQVGINKVKYGASNAALISIDNKTGQILAMVGGVDYFSDDKGSNVNVITSERQPGSSFKPIVYSHAISVNPIGPDTPIYDTSTEFGDWEPDNYDTKFMGRMPLKKALGYSRNIPAIKVFFYGGGENEIIRYANSLGIESLKNGNYYGGPLAIGTGELKPIELVQAYSVFANMGIRKDVTPIIRIEDKKGNIIEDTKENRGVQVLSDAAAYVITNILSDPANRPNDFWNNVLTLKDRKIAAKTGTSNKDVTIKGKEKKILPGDLWTAGYTPQITTVVWAGNTDGSATKGTCDGLNCAAPIWHDYMEYAHRGLEKKTFIEPDSVIHATISRASGKLVTDSTPADLKVSSIFAVKPTEYDGGYTSVKVDSLCNGKISDSTPEEAIRTVYLGTSTNPIIDSYDKEWMKTVRGYIGGDSTGSGSLVSSVSSEPCIRPTKDSSSIMVSTNITDGENIDAAIKKTVDIRFDSNNPIIKIMIYKDGEIYKTIPIDEKNGGNIDQVFDFSKDAVGTHKLIFKAIDKFYYSGENAYKINITNNSDLPQIINDSGSTDSGSTASVKPDKIEIKNTLSLTLINPPEGSSKKIYADQFFNLRGSFSVEPDVINVYMNGNLLKIVDSAKNFTVPINDGNDLIPGSYTLKVEGILGNSRVSKDVKFSVMAK